MSAYEQKIEKWIKISLISLITFLLIGSTILARRSTSAPPSLAAYDAGFLLQPATYSFRVQGSEWLSVNQGLSTGVTILSDNPERPRHVYFGDVKIQPREDGGVFIPTGTDCAAVDGGYLCTRPRGER